MKTRPAQLLARSVAALLVIIYAWVLWMPSADDKVDTVEIEELDSLTIVDIRPGSAAPGSAIVVHFEGGEDKPERGSVSASLRGVELEPAEVRKNEAIFTLPEALALGPSRVVLRAGGETSAPYGLLLERVSLRKVMRNLLGGLGLVLLGLILLSKALRRRAGRTLRQRLGGMTASSWRSLGLGGGVGALTQSSTVTAAIALPFLERPLLNFRATLTLLLGAHLGAAIVGAALPLAGTKHAPLVIAVGVVFRLAAQGRRERAGANLIIGLGVLLHGIYMLRAGFAPLAEHPSILLEVRHIDPTSAWGLLLAASIGAAIGVATQGPGPVFVLVLSMAQSTSLLSMSQALAFLAAVPMGSALSSVLLSSTMGSQARRLAVGHVLIALVMLFVSWALIPFLPGWVALVLDGDPMTVAHGKKILHPDMALHLAASFVAMQVLATVAVIPLVRPLAQRIRPEFSRGGTRDLMGRGPSLNSILDGQRQALDSAHKVWMGDAGELSALDSHLEQSRRLAEKHLERDPRLRDEGHDGLLLSLMALQQSMEHLRDTTGRLPRRGWTLDGPPREIIAGLHELVRIGISGSLALLCDEDGPSVDDLRSREIDANAREADLRRLIETDMKQLKGSEARRLLLFAELASAYEGVGNQVYRLGMALAPDEDF